MFKRRLVIFIILVLVLGSVASYRVVQAGFFDDVVNFFRGASTSSVGTSTEGVVNTEPKAEVPLYKPVLDYEEAVVRAVDIASPSVVSIVVSKDLPIIENCPYDPFGDLPSEFRDFFGGGFQFSQPCERRVQKQEVGGGSGFIVSSDGLILTNKHVVSDIKAEYTVLTNDGKKYGAQVLARDPVQDLAIIKIDATGLTSARLGDSDSLKLGQTAIAIGNSLGEFRNTVSVGVISGLARTITAGNLGARAETIQGVVQTDAAINPGNSGGPLLNLKGEVVGINTAIVSGAQNIGFAIPINQAKKDINSVKQTGFIKTPYFGVRYLLVNSEVQEKQKLPVDYGALVRGTDDGPGVIPGGPAAKAGIMAEDIVLEVGGVRVDIEHPLVFLIQKYNVGDSVLVKVRRGGQTLTFSVKLEERPNL